MVKVPTASGFRRLLLNAVVVPLVLMVLVAVVLIGQITHLLHDSADVERCDRYIADTNKLEKLTIDLETGVRGYLITGDEQFLEPYHRAIAAVDQTSSNLLNEMDDPSLKQQIRGLERIRLMWLDYARSLIEIRKQKGDYASVIKTLEGKRQMDEIRQRFGKLISDESGVRDVHFRDAVYESRVTLIVVAVVAIGGGIVLSVLSRNQFVRLSQTYSAALAEARDLNATLEQRVTERTRELQQRSVELSEANKELEAFSYSISHDLRAPMRHIGGFANLLEKAAGARLTESDRENISVIRNTANLAGRMVDELLSFSRVGRAALKLAPVDLNEVVADCLRELTPDTQNRAIEYKIAKLPIVQGDRALLRLVMLNLLSNAIKYTGKREHAIIEVGIGEAPAAADGANTSQMVMCYIRDNGVGFNMEYAGKLFGVFQRLHRAEEFEGTGIGLANVRRIISRFGGRVWAEGELNRGAIFYFTIPLSRELSA
jgi:signal transduction histidine kinase